MEKEVKMGNQTYICESKRVKGRWTGHTRKKDKKKIGKQTRVFCRKKRKGE